MGQIQNRLRRDCRKVYPIENDQNKILCAMNRCKDQTACKKRKELYHHARKSKDPDVKIHYKRFRAHVQKVLRDAYWKHVSNISTFENNSSDSDTPKHEKIKKFWSFNKSLKQDPFGITSLRENGILKTDAKGKATFVIGNSNQPSHAKSTLTRPQKRLVRSPPWRT